MRHGQNEKKNRMAKKLTPRVETRPKESRMRQIRLGCYSWSATDSPSNRKSIIAILNPLKIRLLLSEEEYTMNTKEITDAHFTEHTVSYLRRPSIEEIVLTSLLKHQKWQTIESKVVLNTSR
jgi:hypothetical protein